LTARTAGAYLLIRRRHGKPVTHHKIFERQSEERGHFVNSASCFVVVVT